MPGHLEARPRPARSGSCQVTVRERSGPQSVVVEVGSCGQLVGHRVSWGRGHASGGGAGRGRRGRRPTSRPQPSRASSTGSRARPGLGEVVLEAVRAGLVLPTLDDAGVGQRLESGGDAVAGRAGAGDDVGEAVGTQGELADDEQRPAFADQLEAGGDAGTVDRGGRRARSRGSGGWTRLLCSPAMSLKVKLTPRRLRTSRTARSPWSPLGTALVLVTYVTPMATVPQTALDLGAGSGARAWILSSMSVGLAAALLASGAVGDAVGRRRTYVAGLLLLGIGCARRVRWRPGQRGLRGSPGARGSRRGRRARLWAGRARPCLHRAGRTGARHGIWGASVGLGITAGALLAAGLGTSAPGGARPTSVVGLVALRARRCPSVRWLPESAAEHPRRLDLAGLVTLAVALTLLVSGLTESRSGLLATTRAALRRRGGRAGGVRRGRVARRRADGRPRAAADPRLPRRHARRARARRRGDRDDLQRARRSCSSGWVARCGPRPG